MPTKTSHKVIETLDAELLGTTMVQEIIGPELAAEYLKLSAPNRNVRSATVSQYARDMTAHKWYPSVIRFGTDEKLWDGQHRLKAVVESGTTHLFWVERNVPIEAIYSIDAGLRRNASDALAIAGETNTNVLAGAIRIAENLETHPAVAPSSWVKFPMSMDEVFTYLDDNPYIRNSVRVGDTTRKYIPYPPTLIAALHYLESKRNPQLTVDFWDKMASGAELKEHTGPYTLRNTIINDRMRDRIDRMSQNELVAISIKAWNYWEYNKPIKQLRWLSVMGEPFPTLGVRPK